MVGKFAASLMNLRVMRAPGCTGWAGPGRSQVHA